MLRQREDRGRCTELRLTLTSWQGASLRREVARVGIPNPSELLMQRNRPVPDVLADAQSELREATRQLVAAGPPSDGRSSETDEEFTRAREMVMAKKGVPIKSLVAGLGLALQYRLEVMMPALIRARPSLRNNVSRRRQAIAVRTRSANQV